jgi:predicted restriction endonuclease
LKSQNNVLPLLDNEANEWHHKNSKNFSCSIPSSNQTSSYFVKSKSISYALAQLEGLNQCANPMTNSC